MEPTADSLPNPVAALLNEAKAKARQVIKAKQAEIADIERALAALKLPPNDAPNPVRSNALAPRGGGSVSDGIIKAVEAGQNRPADILQYLHDELGVQTTFGSVRASLSNLKAKGKVSLSGSGWVSTQKEKPESGPPSSLFS